MKMRLPGHATAFGFQGVNYDPDEDGIVDIPDHAQHEAARHGLTPHVEEEGKAQTKAQLIEILEKRGVEVPAKATKADLIELVAKSEKADK